MAAIKPFREEVEEEGTQSTVALPEASQPAVEPTLDPDTPPLGDARAPRVFKFTAIDADKEMFEAAGQGRWQDVAELVAQQLDEREASSERAYGESALDEDEAAFVDQVLHEDAVAVAGSVRSVPDDIRGETFNVTLWLADRGAAGDLGAIVEHASSRPTRQAELIRMWWIRQELTKALSQHRFRIGEDKGRAAIYLVGKDGRDVEIPSDFIPWFAGPMNHGKYAFFTSNTKMDCPTWDLPSGAPSIGGTCPNAVACQSIVPKVSRENAKASMLPPPGSSGKLRIDEDEAICSACYAAGGNYPSPHVQAGEMARFWWAVACMKSEAGREEFVSTMVEAVLAESRKPTRHGIRPFRVHSSGDFFSPDYFDAWVEIARRVEKLDPSVRFWAPTRVWGQRGYDWDKLRGTKNLVVRPSAYHVGDYAPEPLIDGQARGTTAIYHHDNAGMSAERERLAWGQLTEEKRAALREHFTRVRVRKGLGSGVGEDRRFDWNCVVEGTLVPVRRRGLLAVERVVDLVLRGQDCEVRTRNGWSRVNNARRVGEREVYRLESQAGYAVATTGDHLVAVLSDGWKETGALTPGEMLLLPQEFDGGVFAEDVSLPAFDASMRDHRGFASKIQDGDYRFPTAWSWDLGLVLGALTGDGTFGGRNNVQLSVGERNIGLAQQCARILSTWLGRGVVVSTRAATTTVLRGRSVRGTQKMYRVAVADGALANFLSSFGLAHGVRSPVRVVPAALFTGSGPAVRGYLAGLFSTDGSVSIRPDGSAQASLASTSRNLLLGVQQLFLGLGAKVSVTTTPQYRPPYRPLWTLTARSQRALEVLRQSEIPVTIKAKALAMACEERLRRSRNTRVVKVVRVTSGVVYDLSVDGPQEFVAGGIVVHNCQAYAVAAEGKDLAKSCTNAIGPDGKVGCRACWLSRALRICYTVH